MYLQDGREIYESDKYPGYYVDANSGAFCDERGNYIGGNQDLGDKPGHYSNSGVVWITKTGKRYYKKPTKTAMEPIRLSEAVRKGYKPSRGYRP